MRLFGTIFVKIMLKKCLKILKNFVFHFKKIRIFVNYFLDFKIKEKINGRTV